VLLGDRYGWVPSEDRLVSATLEAGFATATTGRSVTSLEIEYGLLQKDPEQRRRSLIFVRDPLPYERMGTTAAIYSDAYARDAGALERARHLDGLKSKLASDPLLRPHIHRYTLTWNEAVGRPTDRSVEAWGRQVEEAVWRELDAETLAFARQADRSWQEQERFALEEFTERLHRSFIGREELLKEALDFALAPDWKESKESKQYWCFTAESGAGKSAFFSRIYQLLSERKEIILLAEAGGISSRAGRLYWTLRRWIEELATAIGTRADLPEDLRSVELEKCFAEMLAFASANRRVIILADALNQFERTDRVLSMSWVPDPLPTNVRFLATANPGAETEKLSHRAGARVTTLPPFAEAEIEAVARQVYDRYHRSAPAGVISQLRQKSRPDGKPAAGHALWLTLVLDLLNLLDADDFAEAESYGDDTPEQKLHRLVLNRCAATEGHVVNC
jgi:hypothetical protein